MKQEHRFVAQLFAYLAPFVDEQKDIFLSLDGVAAQRGVREMRFQDSIVPDVWLTLVDGRALHVEAKIISSPVGFSVGKDQHKAWFGTATGAHLPTGWVVADENLSSFYYWSHADVRHQPTRPITRGRYYAVTAPSLEPMFASVRGLALHILASAGGVQRR
jgi:hypothetical protein